MADLSIILPETGLTLIGKVYNSSGVQQGSDVSMTESATNVYTGTYNESGLATGTYDEFPILFSASSVIKGDGVLKVNDGAEVNDRFLPNIDTRASQASVDTIDTNVDAILVDTSTTIPNQISGLNDISTADVKAQADQALIDYDPPTRAEATSDKNEIIVEVNANEAKIDIVDTNVDAIKVKTDQLNFTGSDVQSIASNMRGTDGANTIAPDNTTISNIYVDTQRVDSLIENVAGDRFTQKALEQSPTAEVSELEFHSYLDSYTNKDNWKADISGLATQVSIDNLNNLSTTDIDNRLIAYGSPTLAEMTSAFTEIKGAGWTTTDTLEAIRDAINAVGTATTPADIWSYVTRSLTETVTTDTASREASKADVSNLDVAVSTRSSQVSNDTIEGKVDTKPTLTDIENSTKLAKKADIAPLY